MLAAIAWAGLESNSRAVLQFMSDSRRTSLDPLDFLSSTQIFQDLPREQLADLASIARSQTYGKGEILFHQGDEGSGFFIVRSGRIKVFQLAANGREQILHIFAAGAHFAEVPALDGKCFPASAAALEPAEVLFFPRQPFLALLKQNPALAIDLLKSFASHLRRLSALVDNLSLREVPGRLAAYLLDLSDRSENARRVELDMSKGQLAALLGTIPETLSRAFYKLSREGVIAVEGAKIELLDRDRLEQLAE